MARTARTMLSPRILLSAILLAGLSALSLIAPAQAATLIRSSAFEYDPASGLLLKEIIEPDNPQLCLTTTYTYDTYGNKQSATTTHCAGASGDAVITPRSSSSTFETSGRFVATSSNALNHTESKSVDGRFGVAVSLVGPNQLTTSWAIDNFGRKTRETRADGTLTDIT